MFSLFKLVRLISIKEETSSPKISTFAWRQNGERSLLALACTNSKWVENCKQTKSAEGLPVIMIKCLLLECEGSSESDTEFEEILIMISSTGYIWS